MRRRRLAAWIIAAILGLAVPAESDQSLDPGYCTDTLYEMRSQDAIRRVYICGDGVIMLIPLRMLDTRNMKPGIPLPKTLPRHIPLPYTLPAPECVRCPDYGV